ncbi:hypothetical protein J4733_27950 [Klebsiella pneumoniae]|uniref:Acireductone synthase n=1 Tax=Klebsiella pneumoniae TaxID=573 RepID=A0A939NPG7_KLEPN|nr:hypothetical protein [Klebsiella pneumoniae]
MIRAIVTDIEGTTSDIRFVHNVLFPYARERLAGFVTAQHAEPVKTILDNLRRETDARRQHRRPYHYPLHLYG